MKFRKIPVEVEAMQFTSNNEPSSSRKMSEICVWVNAGTGEDDRHAWHNNTDIFIHGRSGGIVTVSVGDWIVRDAEGEFYPCKPETFTETYEPLQ